MEPEEKSQDTSKELAVNQLLEAFTKARQEVGFPTNSKGFDEDVNIYISHLLFAIAMPNYNYITEQYISLDEKDVKMLTDLAEDNYLKYFIYKVNGDNLLLQLGLFTDLKGLIQMDNNKHGNLSEKHFLGLAQQYYEAAAQCNRQIHRKKTALSEVLMKVVTNFKHYAKALSLLRKDYFAFYNFYEDETFAKFHTDFEQFERRYHFEAFQDMFLDLYSKWLMQKSTHLKRQINEVCQALHQLEPSFSFYLK